MRTISLVIPVSPEQLDALSDHFLEGKELGMVPDERAWMLAHARKQHWGCRIVKADLDAVEAQWTLTLEVAN